MLNNTILGAVMLAAIAISPLAVAGDRDFNTAAGAVVGAAIGHNSGGRDGALVGGVLGAVVGNSLSTDDRSYRNRNGGYVETRVYAQPAPVYYQPAPVYYEPAPRYYAPPAVVYVESGRPYYYREYGGRRWEGRRWEGRHGRDGERHGHGYGHDDR